jgi:hypothetical protein
MASSVRSASALLVSLTGSIAKRRGRALLNFTDQPTSTSHDMRTVFVLICVIDTKAKIAILANTE